MLGRMPAPTGPQFTVHTQHWVDGKVQTRRKKFDDFDSAKSYAETRHPDKDGSVMPNVDDRLASHPDYESGVFMDKATNRYAVITKRGNRNA